MTAEEFDWQQAWHRSRLQARAYGQKAVSGVGLSVEYTIKTMKVFSDLLDSHRMTIDDMSDYGPEQRCLECGNLWPCHTVELITHYFGHRRPV
jgi:hypothetical protein